MTYFSRLTDIVTCNLTSLLEEADNPANALEEIIAEMKVGLEGANRAVRTATKNEEKLNQEVEELTEQIVHWTTQAKKALTANDENEARNHLVRKQETSDLLAGLNQQKQAAETTRKHLTTTQHALQARLADAQRKHNQLTNTTTQQTKNEPAERTAQIEKELTALKQELETE